MPRPEKVAKVEEVSAQLSGAAATLLTHYRGLSVSEISELRTKLREADAEMKVVKNTLTRRAASKAGMEGINDLLVGPTGLILCAEDPVGPAKVLKAFAKDHPGLTVRGGFLDGEVLDEVAAIKLADLESREELLEKMAGLMYGALANTARLLQALPEKQARLMQALLDDGGAPGAPADAPVEEAAAEPAPAEEAAAEPAPAEDAPAEDAPAAAADEPAAETADEPVADEPATEAAAPEAEAAAEDAPAADAEASADTDTDTDTKA
jgi:large subunit ribosomal protein L10